MIRRLAEVFHHNIKRYSKLDHSAMIQKKLLSACNIDATEWNNKKDKYDS